MNNLCETCPFNIYPQIPPSETFRADVAIVGMNPGTEEISQKKPFVGKSGQLLRQTLQKSGFTEEPFITNAILCMPPDNAGISRAIIEHCRPRLVKELKQVQPKIILAFGNIAIHALTNDYKLKVSTMHSTPIENELGLLLPVYHPAAILRDSSKKRDAWEDLKAIKNMYTKFSQKPG